MGPLETMASAYTAHKYGWDVWPILSEDCREDIMDNMRAALTALATVELSETAKHAGRPHRGGDELAEGLFRAVLRQIVEEGK